MSHGHIDKTLDKMETISRRGTTLPPPPPPKQVHFEKENYPPPKPDKSPAVYRKILNTRPNEEPEHSINDDHDDWNFTSYHLDYKYTPPPVKGPCCICNEGIIGPMVTALDQMFHPEHFCCANCKIELKTSNYIGKDQKPYCKYCYNELFLPPCAGCGADIFRDNYIHAMQKIWHPDCFKCTQCRKVLDPNKFMEKDSKPYCSPCYHNLFSSKCSHCHKPITDGSGVFAMGKKFHPRCFKCTECSVQLNPNKFWEKNGLPYCENDYNRLFMPKCGGCNYPITTTPTRAMGKDWHPNCFKCTECKKILSPDNFLQKNNKPYCFDDFHRLFSPKCNFCSQPITDPNSMINAHGKNFHPQCHNCSECGKNLGPGDSREKDGKLYCVDDYNRLFMKPCARCTAPITDKHRVVNAIGKSWHPECFSCSVCDKNLRPDDYYSKDGKLYCEDDWHNLFSPRCDFCKLPIKNKCVTALGKKFHPEHFNCEECGKILEDKAFYEKDGKAYCPADYLRLFAPHCRGCKKPIIDDFCLRAIDADWHQNCFRCTDCKTLLEDKKFHVIQDNPFCDSCHHKRQCADCVKIRRAQDHYYERIVGHPLEETTNNSIKKSQSIWEREVMRSSSHATSGGSGSGKYPPQIIVSPENNYNSAYNTSSNYGGSLLSTTSNTNGYGGHNEKILPIQTNGHYSGLSNGNGFSPLSPGERSVSQLSQRSGGLYDTTRSPTPSIMSPGGSSMTPYQYHTSEQERQSGKIPSSSGRDCQFESFMKKEQFHSVSRNF